MEKLYYANMHVDVGDFVARPGEVLEGDFSDEDISRWLKIGAISECGGIPHENPSEPEALGGSKESADSDSESCEDVESEEEVEPEPAQIDVMDGITATALVEAAPKKTRETSGGKTK